MTKRLSVLVSLVICTSPAATRAQVFHEGIYTSGSGFSSGPYDEAFAVIQASDDSYLLLGRSANSTSGSKAILTKIGATGTVTWERSYGDIELTSLVEAASHDGYALFGRHRPNSSSPFLPVLLRVDGSGTLVWARYFSALDETGAAACETHGNNIIVDSQNSKYVVVGDSCSCSGTARHCRPWIAEVGDNAGLAWLKGYLSAGEFEQLGDSTFTSVAQAANTDLVAVGYRTKTVATGTQNWPITAVLTNGGTTRDFLGYSYTMATTKGTVINDVVYDPHQSGSVRVAGTVKEFNFPCGTDTDCGLNVDRAFTGLIAVPSSAMGLGAPSTWRTFEDMTRLDDIATANRGLRLTVAPDGNENVFLGTASVYFCPSMRMMSHPILIRITEDMMTYSGMRYSSQCGHLSTRDGEINGLHWVPAGSGSGATEGLIMSIDYGYWDWTTVTVLSRYQGIVRSDLTGDCDGCNYDVEIQSHELDPVATQIPYNEQDWDIVYWTPDDPEETPYQIACFGL